LLQRLAGRALPERDREVILADLREESIATNADQRWVSRQALRIAARFHAECYRDPDDRLRILALATAGMALLWAVPLVTGASVTGPASALYDPVSQMVLRMWSAVHLTSGLAAGLLVGRLPLLPPHAQPARWHAGLLLAFTAVLVHGAAAGSAAALALLGALWLGIQGRRAADDDHARPAAGLEA
jgi:hypothetical protein